MKNRIAFFNTRWDAVSERWLHRMVKILQDKIKLFVTYDAQPLWENKIKGFTLRPPYYSESPMARFILEKVGQNNQQKIRNYQLRKEINKNSIDIIIINYLTLAVTTQDIWKNFSGRVFIHCHGYDIHFNARRYTPPYIPQHDNQYISQVLSLPKHIIFIVNSIHSKKKLTDIGIQEEKIKVKYFGVETHPQPLKPKKNHGLKIVYVGRLIDCKGPDLLIQAFDKACRKGLKAQLTIAGDGHLRTTCELLARRSPFSHKIKLLGEVSAIEADHLYQSSDIYSAHHCLGPITHREEAFGVSLLEAMSFGLPIVTGASGGVCEIVVDKETGYLFPPNHIDAHSY